METLTQPIEGALDLRRTLRPLHGRFASDGWWLAARTPDGPGTLRLRRTSRILVGEAWGGGAEWLLARASSLAGLDDDPSSFETDDPIVSALHRSHPGWKFGRTDLVFDSLVATICAQKVTGTEARRAMRGLYRRFSDPAPGPNPSLRLPPDPVRIADTPYFRFHDLHLEKRRADLLRRVSGDADRIGRLAQSPPESAAHYLEGIPGISVWTSASTLAVSHGDPDQVPVGDFHIKHMVVHHLTGRDRGTDDEMLELLEPFRPHRGRVVRLLHTLGHEPRFGPRAAPRNITQM